MDSQDWEKSVIMIMLLSSRKSLWKNALMEVGMENDTSTVSQGEDYLSPYHMLNQTRGSQSQEQHLELLLYKTVRDY